MSGLRLTTTMLPISESVDRSRNTPFAKMSKLDLITCRAKSKKDQKINYHMTVALLTISTHHRKMLKYNQFIFFIPGKLWNMYHEIQHVQVQNTEYISK